VGLLFLGWSARDVLILYFIDTLAGCWACLAAVAAWISGSHRLEGVVSGVYSLLSAMGLALVIVPFLAVPLAIPVVFTAGVSSSKADWLALWTSPSFQLAMAVIVLTAVVTTVRHLLALADGERGEASVKQAFAILFTRWVLVMMATFWVVGFLGRYGAYLLVVVYSAASAWSELQPERFANLFPDRRPSEAR